MNLRDIGFVIAINEEPPDCVLREGLEQHLPNLNDFSSVVLALTFDSGPPGNPTARSYVFYFFRGEADTNRRPDDILTFKIRFDDPFKVHIVDKYLGGMAYGAKNAPALAYRHLWRPGIMSPEGRVKSKQYFREQIKRIGGKEEVIEEVTEGLFGETSEKKERKSGCFIATAAFGTPFAKEVIALSKFRDEILQRTSLGRSFIKLYYKICLSG